ncbi:MAG: hypothetical protein JWP57_2447 [Spirosoma sp.]|nr:hypothetical protein [Spirosoma sp.]
MKLIILPLLLSLTFGFSAFTGPLPQDTHKDRPTKLAHYQAGAYIAASGTKLRVNVDKQLGGQVTIQLTDAKSKVYFEQTMNPLETTARLSLDILDLSDGDYWLKVSNGLEVVIREIKISTPKPTTALRSVTVQ